MKKPLIGSLSSVPISRCVSRVAKREMRPRFWPELAALPPAIAEQLEIDARYAGYLERQARDIAAFRRDETLMLPEELDYAAVGGLSAEVRGKLAAARPATLGAAGRISGVTPAALVALLQYVKRRPEAA